MLHIVLEGQKDRMFNKKMPINANSLLTRIFETYLAGMIYLRILLKLNNPIHIP
jgi:hypothetical protein